MFIIVAVVFVPMLAEHELGSINIIVTITMQLASDPNCHCLPITRMIVITRAAIPVLSLHHLAMQMADSRMPLASMSLWFRVTWKTCWR